MEKRPIGRPRKHPLRLMAEGETLLFPWADRDSIAHAVKRVRHELKFNLTLRERLDLSPVQLEVRRG